MITTRTAFPRKAATAIALVLAMQGASALAQLPSTSDPAVINEELRRRQEENLREQQREQGPAADAERPADQAPPADSGVTFELRSVQFDDSAFLSQRALQNIARDYVGRPVSFGDLNELVARVNRLYDNKGHVTARAILPPQKIENGVVVVRLVEGRLQQVTIVNSTKFSDSEIRDWIGLSDGDVIDVPELERDLLIFNRVNNTQLRASLRPGEAFGTTTLELTVLPADRLYADFFIDNNGFNATGELEGGVLVRSADLLGNGDRLGLFAVGADGSISGSLFYSRLLTRKLRVGFNYVRGSTQVVNGPFAAADVEGDSQTAAIFAEYPLGFVAGGVLSLNAGGQHTVSQTDVGGVAVSDSRILQGQGGVSYDYVDRNTFLSAQLNGVYASFDERLFTDERDATLFRGSFYARQFLAPRWRTSLEAHWQYTETDDLPGTLEFQIGGANSARAFDPGAATGDRGYFVSWEVGRTFGDGGFSTEPFLFVDYGETRSLFPDQRVGSAGLGFNTLFGRRVRLETLFAVPIVGDGIGPHDDYRISAGIHVTPF